MIELYNQVLHAAENIHPYIRETPLQHSLILSKIMNANVYLKCENLQYTNSFKVRGAFNKMLSLTSEQRKQGIVTASSGNHAGAVAYGLYKLGIQGKVFVTKNISPAKIDNIRQFNVHIGFYGNECMETEHYAIEYAEKNNMIYISPYNDPMVIAGQGTIALECHRQLNKIDAIFAPVSGGGLISGIGWYMRYISPETKIFGCSPENSPVMANSVKANKIVEMNTKPTYSDATAGGIISNTITLEYCQKLVDEFILVSEYEIEVAIQTLIKTQHFLIEGAAALTLSAYLQKAEEFQNKNIILVLSGSNISLETLKTALNKKITEVNY